ncbi:coenzyme F420-reducing hydrogenase delta subunit [Desulfosalsimonas propionicica]|uniref:Coenzyme F420-reducing hydrogenase delta subunit n=2 Tax=Desulfosalsimonas propionicica TaxID=332175 RepID=A0A7W0CBX4_9BACT|nr:coenzyme F420-reducing hydrogenase delta subunit [Desulfosalsimonas propionicica]
MRLTYPTSFRIIRVPCAGKVDVQHLLRALEKGADGVCIIGCMEGECLYKTGNLRARKRVEQAQQILKAVGIDPQRALMYNLSSNDGPLFAKYAAEMDELIRKIGPSPMKKKTKTAA